MIIHQEPRTFEPLLDKDLFSLSFSAIDVFGDGESECASLSGN